ncbi:MAG TPA: ATP-binding protein [Anaeromyxobacteraceae bacterium]|nr:ATP-binding protein [Anaeromyxobacteraceae bacterium]
MLAPVKASESSLLPSLETLLRDHRDDIVRRWIDRVRRDVDEHLPRPEMVDHLPEILDRIEDAVRTHGAPDPAGERAARRSAARHGAQRAQLGLDVRDLLAEYTVLRDVILDVIEESGLLPAIPEIRTLSAVLTACVAESLCEYTEERDRRFRAAAARFREIADHAPAVIFVKDAQGKYEFVNHAYAALVDKEPGAIVGRTDHDILPADVAAHFAPSDARVAAGESVELEECFPTALGARFYRMVKFPLRNEPRGMAVIGVDVTDAKATQRRVQEAAEFERQLIGIVSHDLRTPVAALQLAAQALAARSDLPDGAARTLARIVSAADRTSRMIRDLLDLTRARLGGGIPIDRREVDAAAMLRQVVDELTSARRDAVVRLHVEGATTGRWDPDRLAQVFENLVRNALDHGAPGGPVTVSLRGGRAELRAEVHNTGEPISPDLLPRIFESGVRGAAAAHGHGGLGIGLYVVERVIAAHGGRVTVASTREAGTTFTIVLPRVPAA